MKKSYAYLILSFAGLAALPGCGAGWRKGDEKGPKKVASEVDTLSRVEEEGYLLDDLDTSVDTEMGLDFDLPMVQGDRELIPVYFDYGKSSFKGREDQEKVCKREAREAKEIWDRARAEGRDVRFVVEGRSCDKGKAKEVYKEKVGLRRAEIVASMFEKEGIPRSAIEVASLGSRDSKLAPGTDPVMHALNRRVDVRVVEA